MAAAEANARDTHGAGEGQVTPPADGIMTPEAAERELPPGSAALLVLGGDGASPKLRLGTQRLALGAGPQGKLLLSYRSGGSVMPTIEFDLKPKLTLEAVGTEPASPAVAVAGSAEAAPHEPGSGAQAPSSNPVGGVAMRFGLSGARPAADQPGRLPDNARSEIAKLNGSWVESVTTPAGALKAQRFSRAGNNPDLQPLVTGSAEVLASVVLPYPAAPVGVGAFWMLKSRETVSGAMVLVYRMVKVTGIERDTAQLSVNTRRYLLTQGLPLAGMPPHQVRRFESEGNATLSVHAGSVYPDTAEVQDSFVALVAPNDRPNQAVPVQSELSAKLSFAAAR